MTQHYLRSAAYRDFSIHSIYGMSDDDIHAMFARLRWSSDSHQACPACGAWAQHYRRPARQQWRCKECGRDFSVTSATAFSSRKKSLRSILLATFYYVTGVKGLAGLGLSRMGDYSNKAAHVALGKLREAIFRTQDFTPLTGVVEIDGGYFRWKASKAKSSWTPQRPGHCRSDRRTPGQTPMARQRHDTDELGEAEEQARSDDLPTARTTRRRCGAQHCRRCQIGERQGCREADRALRQLRSNHHDRRKSRLRDRFSDTHPLRCQA
ncbi:hypothetical protein XAC908_810006 [Xanthomonas citri pv. citri]|nr:hypothetical protein XAC908_810006 [Xanthomonas citri pv. citri]